MAIETKAYFRRLARTGVVLLIGMLLVCGAAVAAAPPAITTGSVVPIPTEPSSWGQIHKVCFYDGNVLALDTDHDALYQLSPGAKTWTHLVDAHATAGQPGYSNLFGPSGSGYEAQDCAIDAVGTLYISLRYSGASYNGASDIGSIFFRVPYDSTKKTWDITAADGWGSAIGDPVGGKNFGAEGVGVMEFAFVDSPARDGSGTLYWEGNNDCIYSIPVDNTGTPDPADQPYPEATIIINKMLADGHFVADVNGNIYYLELNSESGSARVNGIFFIPPGTDIEGVKGGAAEAQLYSIEPTSGIVYAGIGLDAGGNLYLTSETYSGYNETQSGLWTIPNECGSAAAVNSGTCLNYSDISLLSPFAYNSNPSPDSRGFIWAPVYVNSTGTDGSAALPATDVYALMVWAPGSINLGASPAGAPGPASTLYVSFNEPVTLNATNNYLFSEAGGKTDFILVNTDPNAATPPSTTSQCGSSAQQASLSSCEIWPELKASAPGAISGEITISGVNSNSIAVQNVTYLSGIGQGAEAAMLASPQLTTIATTPVLDTPAQVASDAAGDVYVADPGLKEVLYFPAGSTTGTPFGSFTAPTGVAVDGAGDVYVADSKRVVEYPATNGSAAAAKPVNIASNLGLHLNLAVDGVGDVYIADADHGQVIKVPNPAAANLIFQSSTTTTITVGSGFTSPSAVAVDSLGDVFVADGNNLWEVTPVFPWTAQTPITNGLDGTVTGLAVDASGSVIVSQANGLLRIPNQVTSNSSGLNFNSASQLATSVSLPSGKSVSISLPNGVALDQSGNIYVSDMTNGPNLYQLSVNGSVDFGDALTASAANEADAVIFNIGNLPMTLSGSPAFSGPDTTPTNDFAMTTPSEGIACDFTGQTPVATGTSCTVGLDFTPPAKGFYSGDSVVVSTSAANIAGGGGISAALFGTAFANFEATQTSVSLNPGASTYPGATTVTVTVTPEPSQAVPGAGLTPSGSVTLTLTSLTNSSQPQQTFTGQAQGDSTGTSVTFPLSAIQGGTYCVMASYAGSVANLFQKSQSAACSTTAPYTPATSIFTVAPATPAISLSEPSGVTPNSANGVYYVKNGDSVILAANVSSPLGSPTGSFVYTSGAPLPGGSVVGTSPLDANGNANPPFNTESLPNATYSIYANYTGDQNFAPVSSPAIVFQVVSPGVLITSNPTSLSTTGGTPVSATLTLNSIASFAQNVAISCDNSTLPYYSECTFSNTQPSICVPPGSAKAPCPAVATTEVTISSNIPVNVPPSTSANLHSHGLGNAPLIPAGIFSLGIFGLALRRKSIFDKRLLSGGAFLLMLIGAAMAFSGCTNKSYTHTPPVQTYTTPSGASKVRIIVTDVSSGAVYSLPFTLPLTIK